MINIRPAINSDTDHLLHLLIETVKSSCKNDYDQEQINAWISSTKNPEHWHKFIHDQYSLVAEINNKAVGFGSLENGNFIYFIYVDKDYQGQGVAGEIYDHLEKESLKLENTQILANVSKTALSFFTGKGFKIVKDNINVIDEITIINYEMQKPLVIYKKLN